MDWSTHLAQARGLSPQTIATYGGVLRGFRRFLNGSPESSQAALSYLATALTPGTKIVWAAALRSYFAWAYPGEKLAFRVKRSEALPKPLTRGEVWLLLHRIQGPLRLVVLLMAFAGLRVSEACTLRVNALDHQAQALRVWGKGNKERLVHLPPTLFLLLSQVAQGKAAATYYFPGRVRRKPLARSTVEQHLASLSQELYIPQLYPHRLRHFYATWLYAFTLDPFRVAREMGHSDLKTTMGYAGLVQVPAGLVSMEDLLQEMLA